MSTINWGGYTFTIYSPNSNWSNTSGIYIFAGQNGNGQWVALYIGQASSFADRFSNHEKWAPAVRHGATHVHAMTASKQSDRDQIESDLIKRYQPRLNDQLK